MTAASLASTGVPRAEPATRLGSNRVGSGADGVECHPTLPPKQTLRDAHRHTRQRRDVKRGGAATAVRLWRSPCSEQPPAAAVDENCQWPGPSGALNACVDCRPYASVRASLIEAARGTGAQGFGGFRLGASPPATRTPLSVGSGKLNPLRPSARSKNKNLLDILQRFPLTRSSPYSVPFQ